MKTGQCYLHDFSLIKFVLKENKVIQNYRIKNETD